LLHFEKDAQNSCTNKIIKIAPAEHNRPRPLSELEAEEKSFPTIYCGKPRKFPSSVKFTYTDIAKHELKHYNRIACRPDKVLYSFKKSFNEKVYNAMSIHVRKQPEHGRVTAGDTQDADYMNRLLTSDDGYKVFKNIRSSPCYWKEKTKHVLAMLRQLGFPALFITFSAAETRWGELLVSLKRISGRIEITEEEAINLPFSERAELIRNDPVTCIEYFKHRFIKYLHGPIRKPGGVFAPYAVMDHFFRAEFQLRGSEHIHGFVWLKDAPVYNASKSTPILFHISLYSFDC